MNHEQAVTLFSEFSHYWVSPLSNVAIAFVALRFLVPFVRSITNEQIRLAVGVLQTARELPKTIEQMTQAASGLHDLNREVVALQTQLKTLDSISEQLEIANRKISDIQNITEEQGNTSPPQSALSPAERTGFAEASGGETIHQIQENRDKLGKIWSNAKLVIENKIDGIIDGRIRRKYNTVPRHKYGLVSEYLRNDGLLTEDAVIAINRMDQIFGTHRNNRIPVTKPILQEFERQYGIFSRE